MNRQKKLQTAISFALFRMQMHTHPDSPHAGIPLKHTLSWADFLHDSELYNAWKHTPHENKSVSYKMHFANWWAWVHHCVCQLLLDRLKYCRNWWCINCKYLQKNYLHHQRKSSQSVQSMIIFCLLFFSFFYFCWLLFHSSISIFIPRSLCLLVFWNEYCFVFQHTHPDLFLSLQLYIFWPIF